MVASQAQFYHVPSEIPYGWTCAWGEDEFGIWTEFEFRGVVQRLRWIPPGSFSMGSPDNEPERGDNELLHEVELTRGFWLADTVCTQALWKAVMGENPSNFKGSEWPVENVSWDDCHVFFKRINDEVAGLALRFPTEAQWEYACRSGTLTPFWFGDTVTIEQVNFNGDHPYAGGVKRVSRKETVPVKALPQNSWGLYQMHGNVWEWCSDWYCPYEERNGIDPQGPIEGEERVLRGGSWFYDARDCRSASRNWSLPDNRHWFIGFRLSREEKC